jgi:hypothetical protein
MSTWKCELCGEEMRTTQKSGHKTWRCPKQGNGLKRLRQQEREAAKAEPPAPKPDRYLLCVCGCETKIRQVTGQRKKQFVNTDHYEKWRRASLKAAGGDPDEAQEKKLAEELAPITSKDAEIARAAEQVPMVTGEASFRLWGRCLGFSVDVAQAAA